MKLSIAEAIERLGIVNNKMWHLEDKMLSKSTALKEKGRIGIQLRELNNERIKLKNYLNSFFNTGFKETKVYSE